MLDECALPIIEQCKPLQRLKWGAVVLHAPCPITTKPVQRTDNQDIGADAKTRANRRQYLYTERNVRDGNGHVGKYVR